MRDALRMRKRGAFFRARAVAPAAGDTGPAADDMLLMRIEAPMLGCNWRSLDAPRIAWSSRSCSTPCDWLLLHLETKGAALFKSRLLQRNMLRGETHLMNV